MILVTAANGRIGSHVVRQLIAQREPTRVIARDPGKLALDGVEVVRGDLDRADTLDAAFRGVTKLLLIAPGPDVAAQDAALIAAARRANVAHVVMVTSLGIELGGIAGGKVHMTGEQQLRDSGLTWTLLHPSEFMTNALWWAGTIKGAGAIFLPAGTGKVGFIDPADIAAVAVKVLTTPGHEGKVYRLTGPQALGIAELASQLGEVVGRPIRYTDIPEPAFRDGAGKAGTPPPVVEMMVEYYAAVREGRVDVVTRDIPDLIGRPARSFGEWAREQAAAFA